MKKQISLTIKGMHCSSCETLIKDELTTLPDVSNINIYYKTGKGSLILDSEKNSENEVIQAVKKAGYIATIDGGRNLNLKKDNTEIIKKTIKANEPSKITFEIKIETPETQKENTKPLQKNGNSQKSVSLSLSGMHCSSCALIIEKSLNKVPGIKEAHVNFAAEKALVIYDESAVKKESFIDVVKRTGYSASFIDEKDSQFEANKRKKEIQSLFNKFLISFVLSFPMLYFMFFDFFSWIPGKAFFLPLVGIISFVLATPVQFIIGRGFYKGMWSALRMKTFNMDSLIAIGTSVAYFYSKQVA